MKHWHILPLDTPRVIRACPKCGPDARYASSGKFRVNANGRLLDIWLITRCTQCDNTLNLEIHARTRPTDIPRDLLRRYEANDRDLAFACALDAATFRRNRARPCFEHMTYRIEETAAPGDDALLRILCGCDLPVRLDLILAQGLGLPRAQVQRRLKQGRITGEDGPVLASDRLGRGVLLRIHPGSPSQG